ncbi:MAG: FkbM family methyltransferase, partial [Methylobacteriaceae bacterium]|nr:FkbM family methyltransferase [Methylobacteriaceae bacterium]
PDEQWIIEAAISDVNAPAFFPVGAPGSGAQNCISTNRARARNDYVRQLTRFGRSRRALSNLLLHNTTGLKKSLVPGKKFDAEIKLVSSVTLRDVLGPFDRVDLLESDIQQSEIVVFPPFMDILKRKVRRIHMGTHGPEVHRTLHNLFVEWGWGIVFSFLPEMEHDTEIGRFSLNDGILSVRNPDI